RPLDEYLVREANGQERIEYLPGMGGRWLVKAKGAPYGFTISCAVVDEAWNVETNHVEEGVAPTMVERVAPQLLLISQARRLATSLMLTRRKVALDELETGHGDLLVEWSAPRSALIDEPATWRQASPHWSAQRQKQISRKIDAMYSGETPDQTESDPVESFRAEWLCQWLKGLTLRVGEEFLPPGLWASLAEELPESTAPLWIAIEDNYGQGGAFAAAALLDDGRLEVGGWTRPDWDSVVLDVLRLGALRTIRQLQVGASMLNHVPP